MSQRAQDVQKPGGAFERLLIYCSQGLNRHLSGKRESPREKQDPFPFK